MIGQRDARADIETFRFIKGGHSSLTSVRRLGFLTAASMLGGCQGNFSTLDPAGPAAEGIATLWWVMFAGAMVILFGVMAIALWALRHREERKLSEKRMLLGWGLVFPGVTLGALMVFAFAFGEQLLARPGLDRLEIRAHARQWHWVFEYPDGSQTQAALHVPAGQPFHLRLTSEDVIHSFWVPRLGGKMDAIPGKENVLALQSDAPGLYRGLCAEYCGVGHAHMMVEVHAHDPARYAAARAAAAGDAPPDPLPVLEKRRSPAADALANGYDHVLRWIGLK